MHGPQQLAHGFQLWTQLLRHGFAGALVGIVHGMAKGGRVHIQHHAERIRAIGIQRLEKHAEKAVNRVGIIAVGGGQQGQGVKAAKDQAVAIHQHYRRFGHSNLQRAD